MPTKVHLVKAMVFPVVMYGCESRTVKKAERWRTDAFELEKTLESPLDCKEIRPVSPKGNQFWIFTGRTDAEAETPILWPPDVKSQLIGKDPHAGKDWRQEEKGMTEDEMVGWHHRLNGHEFEQALGVGDGQGGLVCCSPWSRKESHTTEQRNWTELIMGRGAWRATVHRVSKSRTWLKWLSMHAFINSVLLLFFVTKSCLTLCNPMHCGTPGFPVLHHLLKLDQTHVLHVDDGIQPSPL